MKAPLVDPITARLRRLVRKHRLARVAIVLNPSNVIVTAIPDAAHPIVADRAKRHMEALARNGSVTLADIDEAATRAATEPLAVFRGDTITLALDALEGGLKFMEANP